MAFSLDHVVVAVRDLDRAADDYRSLGFTVYPGGVHKDGSSHNALIVLADGSYFEIIAYRQDAPANRWWNELKTAGDGIVDFAVVPGNLREHLAASIGRGLDIEGPFAGGRLRPDGVQIEWEIARPSTTDLPFWCGDVTPRERRVPRGALRRHANGASGIALLRIAVTDPKVTGDRYRALVGPEAVRKHEGTTLIDISGTTLELVGPDHDDARERLGLRGEGILSIRLQGASTRSFDTKLLHGVELSIGDHR